jgi:hypothetical protein
MKSFPETFGMNTVHCFTRQTTVMLSCFNSWVLCCGGLPFWCFRQTDSIHPQSTVTEQLLLILGLKSTEFCALIGRYVVSEKAERNSSLFPGTIFPILFWMQAVRWSYTEKILNENILSGLSSAGQVLSITSLCCIPGQTKMVTTFWVQIVV